MEIARAECSNSHIVQLPLVTMTTVIVQLVSTRAQSMLLLLCFRSALIGVLATVWASTLTVELYIK